MFACILRLTNGKPKLKTVFGFKFSVITSPRSLILCPQGSKALRSFKHMQS